MLASSTLILAELSKPTPLFGSPWLALLAILAGVALLMAAIAFIGRWLAATHPEATPRVAISAAAPAEITATPAKEIPPEIMVAIVAAVAATCGTSARIASVVRQTPTVAVEILMGQWAIEGRRQIYSSHKVR